MNERKEILPSFIMTIVILTLVFVLMNYLQPKLLENPQIKSFGDIFTGAASKQLPERLLWFVGDMTEAYFFKSYLASIFLIMAGWVAFSLEKKGKFFFQIPIMNGCGLFIPVFTAATLGLIISNLVYFDLSAGWIPTFVPFISTAPALVLVFGGEPIKVITSGILAGLVPYPFADFLMKNFAEPLQLPGFCGVAIGMGIATILSIELCHKLPWMVKKSANPKNIPPLPNPPTGKKLYIARLFQDIGEPIFWGNGLTTMALYAGLLISWLINPASVRYGSGNLPVFLYGTLLTIALSVFIWYPRYVKNGFVFTFTSAVCTGAVFNTYQETPIIFISTVIFSALVLPWFIDILFTKIKRVEKWHPCCIAIPSIGIVTSVWSLVVIYCLNGLK